MENNNRDSMGPQVPVPALLPKKRVSILGVVLVLIYLLATAGAILYGFNCSETFCGLRPIFYPIMPWPWFFSAVLDHLTIVLYVVLVILNSVILYFIGWLVLKLFHIDIPGAARKVYIILGASVVVILLALLSYRFVNQKQPVGGPYYKSVLGVYERRDVFHGGFMFYSTDTYYKKVANVNSSTFKFLDDVYATDGVHVFCGQEIPDIDAASFQILGSGYAKDKDNLYLHCEKMVKRESPDASATSFDTASVQPMECNTVKDKNGVYVNVHYADSDQPNYAVDIVKTGNGFMNQAAFMLRVFTLDKIPNADPQTFKITDTTSCKAQDANYSYVYRYEPPSGFNVYNVTLQAQQATQTTIQWQLYSNADSKIKIYYPQDFTTKVFSYPSTGSSTVPAYLQVDFGEPGEQANAMPVMFENNNLTKLYKPMSSLREYILDQYRTADIQDITINGKQAEQFSRDDGVTYTYFFRQSDQEIFEFILWNTLPKYQNIYQQMLEKFEY